MIPQMRPALALERPPMAPPLESISRTTRLPITHANGAARPHATRPTIPRMSTVFACGWSGAIGPYIGCGPR